MLLGLVRAAVEFGRFVLLMLITRGPLAQSDFEWLLGDLGSEPHLTPIPSLVFAAIAALAAVFVREKPRLSFVLFLVLALPGLAVFRTPDGTGVTALSVLLIGLLYFAPLVLLGLALGRSWGQGTREVGDRR